MEGGYFVVKSVRPLAICKARANQPETEQSPMKQDFSPRFSDNTSVSLTRWLPKLHPPATHPKRAAMPNWQSLAQHGLESPTWPLPYQEWISCDSNGRQGFAGLVRARDVGFVSLFEKQGQATFESSCLTHKGLLRTLVKCVIHLVSVYRDEHFSQRLLVSPNPSSWRNKLE